MNFQYFGLIELYGARNSYAFHDSFYEDSRANFVRSIRGIINEKYKNSLGISFVIHDSCFLATDCEESLCMMVSEIIVEVFKNCNLLCKCRLSASANTSRTKGRNRDFYFGIKNSSFDASPLETKDTLSVQNKDYLEYNDIFKMPSSSGSIKSFAFFEIGLHPIFTSLYTHIHSSKAIGAEIVEGLNRFESRFDSTYYYRRAKSNRYKAFTSYPILSLLNSSIEYVGEFLALTGKYLKIPKTIPHLLPFYHQLVSNPTHFIQDQLGSDQNYSSLFAPALISSSYWPLFFDYKGSELIYLSYLNFGVSFLKNIILDNTAIQLIFDQIRGVVLSSGDIDLPKEIAESERLDEIKFHILSVQRTIKIEGFRNFFFQYSTEVPDHVIEPRISQIILRYLLL